MRPFRCTLAVLAIACAAHAQSAHDYLLELARTHRAPAISAAVAVGGKIVFSESTGLADIENGVPATAATVYNIGSVSKVISAVAVMQLVEEGKVSLDDPIQKFVPWFPVKPEGTITVRHLLTHTSGIRHYLPTDFPGTPDDENIDPNFTWEKGIRLFASDPLLFAPGHGFKYSSYGVNLLQGVVETASGTSFEDYLKRRVWTPAGMTSSTLDVPSRIVPHRARSYRLENGNNVNYYYNDLRYKFPSGGMMATAEDLVRLCAAMNEGRLLRPETVKLMYRPYVQRDEDHFAQGLIWRVYADGAVGHCGTVKGFNACVVNDPDADVAAAIIGNSEEAPARLPTIALARMFLRAGK